MKSITDRVTEILVAQLGVSDESVTPTATLKDDLGADSLDCVTVAMDFEEDYDIEIPDGDMEQLVTVADLVAYVERRLVSREAQTRG